jgi:hypothetical protein
MSDPNSEATQTGAPFVLGEVTVTLSVPEVRRLNSMLQGAIQTHENWLEVTPEPKKNPLYVRFTEMNSLHRSALDKILTAFNKL